MVATFAVGEIEITAMPGDIVIAPVGTPTTSPETILDPIQPSRACDRLAGSS
jgi:hypothetical protein